MDPGPPTRCGLIWAERLDDLEQEGDILGADLSAWLLSQNIYCKLAKAAAKCLAGLGADAFPVPVPMYSYASADVNEH